MVKTSEDTTIEIYSEEVQRPVDLKQGLQLLPVEKQQIVLAEYKERRDHFRHWLLSQLTEGVHYGFPPGCEVKYDSDGNTLVYVKGGWHKLNPRQWRPKASLYKAGALYLVDLLKLRATYSSDLDAWKMMGEPKGVLVRTCKLINPSSGEVLGEGTGSYEIGNKGMNQNSAIKMADKAAVVAAVINTLAISDLFSQDTEDRKQDNILSPEMENEFPVFVQKWVDESIDKKSPLSGYKITNRDAKALRANLSIWCKGSIPSTAKELIEWCRRNCKVVEQTNNENKSVGIKFVLDNKKQKDEKEDPENFEKDAIRKVKIIYNSGGKNYLGALKERFSLNPKVVNGEELGVKKEKLSAFVEELDSILEKMKQIA